MKNILKKTVALDLIMILLATAIIVTQIPIHARDIPVEWDVTLNFIETGDGVDSVIFGEHSDGCDGPTGSGASGNDDYDVQKAPAPMTPYIRAWFDDGLDVPFDYLHIDYRQYPDDYKEWNLSIQWTPSDYNSSTNITISWDINDINDSEYDDVVLYDVSSSSVVANMLIDTQYTFNAFAIVPKAFQIICDTNQPPYMPSNPIPINHATEIDIDIVSWSGGDPDPGDTVTYDVYFGTTNPPHQVVWNQSSNSYDPGTLSYDTTYYWQIVAWDNHNAQKSGPIWSFTTKSSDGDPGPGPGPGPSPEQNEPPIADANGPYIGAIGIPVTFDGSGSSDPDGDITNYTWHFGDGTEGYGEITDHIYAETGNYTVTLLVTDNGGIKRSNLTYAIITSVANNPPSTPVVTGSKMGQKNIIYNYTAVSTDLDNDTIRYFFDWGDGTDTTSDFLASGTVYNTSHNWTTSGVYTVAVYAEDINGGVSGTTEMTVFIDVNVLFIDDVIQGYLLDTNDDGIYDVFHNNATGDTTVVERQNDGSYLIDIDGDDDWDYIYDPAAGVTAYQNEEQQKEKQKSTPGFELIIVVCAIAVFLFWNRKRRDVY